MLQKHSGFCINVASATRQISCGKITKVQLKGIAHGDIKLENVLVKQDQSGALACELIDFGCSCIEGQNRQQFVSRPWNAPEIISNEEVPCSTIVTADWYSFGLLCVQMLLPKESLMQNRLLFTRRGQPDDSWKQTLANVEARKRDDSLGKTLMSLVDTCGIHPTQQAFLQKIIGNTIHSNPMHRSMDWEKVKAIFSSLNCDLK
jgi:serine/threonine protein kinase